MLLYARLCCKMFADDHFFRMELTAVLIGIFVISPRNYNDMPSIVPNFPSILTGDDLMR